MAKRKAPVSKVGSTNVADFHYDRKKRELWVDFIRRKGRSRSATYLYEGVEPETARALRRAKSKGRFMNAIAYDYEYTRVK